MKILIAFLAIAGAVLGQSLGGSLQQPSTGTGGAVASVTGAGSVTCTPTTGAVVCTGTGANTALSNLSSPTPNATLLPLVGVDAGGASNPFRNFYFYGTSTYGTGSIEFTGAPSAARVVTFPDTSGTVLESGSAASGDLSGAYPGPTVSKINGAAVPASQPCLGSNGSSQLIAGICPFYNVTTYGASTSASGATNATAFQAAVTAAHAAGGGVVWVPAGTYNLTSSANTASISITTPDVSLMGAGKSAVFLNYTGAGYCILWQMASFPTSGAGTMSGFTITGTSSGQAGIESGTITESGTMDISVNGFSTGYGFELTNQSGAWTERNVYKNTSASGNLVDWHLKVASGGHNSFGYNQWIGSMVNVDTGQTGFWADAGTYTYNGSLQLGCNMGTGNSGSGNVICIRVTGNIGGNTAFENVSVTGEQSTVGPGTGSLYSLQVDSGGVYLAGGLGVNVSSATINNLNGATYNPTARFVPNFGNADTGTFTLNGVSTSVYPFNANPAGTVGLITGTNINSPYVSMYNAANNAFTVNTVGNGTSLGAMATVLSVNTSGNVVASGSATFNGSSASSIKNASLQISGDVAPTGAGIELHYNGTYGAIYTYDRTGSAYKPLIFGNGGNQLYLNGTTGNVCVGTATCTSGSLFQVAGSASVSSFTDTGSLKTGTASNADLTGELAFSAATTASYTFAGTYTSHPECWTQAQGSTATSGSPYVTYTGATSMTINFPVAFTGSVSYGCTGRN